MLDYIYVSTQLAKNNIFHQIIWKFTSWYTKICFSEIYPVGLLLLDSMILSTITSQEIQGGEGS